MTSFAHTLQPSGSTAAVDIVRHLREVAVSDSDRDAARLRLADTAVAALVGSRTQQGWESAQLAESLHGSRSTAGLAFRLTAACRMTEIDDIDLLSCITPGSVVVPTVLALMSAEGGRFELDGVLDVIVRGYEVALGLGEAMRGPHRLGVGAWPTLAVGGVTAATVTTLLLGWADDEVAAAIMLASQQSVQANPRGNARECLLAGAVVTGIGCALAARRGFSISGNRAGGVLAELLDTWPADAGPARIHRPSIKPFCAARQAITAVSAVRSILTDTGLSPAKIDRIDVEAPPEYAAMLDKPIVSSRRESVSSAQYQLALALLDPVGLYDVERQKLRADEAFHALMSVIHVHPADDLSTQYPARWPARVQIEADGRTFKATADEVPGERDSSAQNLAGKVRKLSQVVPELSRSATDLIDRAMHAVDVADLLGIGAALDNRQVPRTEQSVTQTARASTTSATGRPPASDPGYLADPEHPHRPRRSASP